MVALRRMLPFLMVLGMLASIPLAAGCRIVVEDPDQPRQGGGGGGSPQSVNSGGGGGGSYSGGGGSGGGYGTLWVNNESNTTIYRVRFSFASDPNWGPDQLGASEVIGAGCTRSWSVPSGSYHVKIEFSDGRELDSLEEYYVPASGSVTCRVFDY